MKRCIIIAIIALAAISLSGQSIILRRSVGGAPPPPTDTIWTDDFESYSVGNDLGSQSNWTQQVGSGAIDIGLFGSDQTADPNASSNVECGVYWSANGPFNDMRVELYSHRPANFNELGPAVRMSSTDESCYVWWGNAAAGRNNSQLIRYNAGTPTVLSTGNAWVAGQTYEIKAVGDSIFCYRNGVLDTSIDGDGIYVDSSVDKLTSGYGGLFGRGNDSNSETDNFELETLD